MRLELTKAFVLAWTVLAVVGGTAWGQRDGPGETPRLFAVPARTYSASGKPSANALHQMQYREVVEHLLRSYNDVDRLERLPSAEGTVLDTEAKRDEAIHKLVAALKDRWTVYRSPLELADTQRHYAYGEVALGLILDRQESGDYIVSYVSGGSAAYHAGLLRGDRIVSIDGTKLEGLSQDAVNALLFAYPGDIVLTYGHGEKMTDVTLVVDAAAGQDVTARTVEGFWYFHVQHFSSENVLRDFAAKAAELNSALKPGEIPAGIVLDLRGNQGGYMDVAYQFVCSFVKEGKVGEHVTRSGRVLSRTSLEAQAIAPTLLSPSRQNLRLVSILQEAPLVVLVNGSTISAGEMVTSALKGTRRATVMGTTTWGKGVSFHTLNLSSGGTLQICTGVFSGPDGLDHRNNGIKPNVVVEQPRASETDRQLAAAVKFLNSNAVGAQKNVTATPASSNHPGLILSGTLFGLALLLVLAGRGRRSSRIRRNHPREDGMDAGFAAWVEQIDSTAVRSNAEALGADAALETHSAEKRADAGFVETGSAETGAVEVVPFDVVLTRDHFMVGARCYNCDHHFETNEAVVEVPAASGSYMYCQACRPAATAATKHRD